MRRSKEGKSLRFFVLTYSGTNCAQTWPLTLEGTPFADAQIRYAIAIAKLTTLTRNL